MAEKTGLYLDFLRLNQKGKEQMLEFYYFLLKNPDTSEPSTPNIISERLGKKNNDEPSSLYLLITNYSRKLSFKQRIRFFLYKIASFFN